VGASATGLQIAEEIHGSGRPVILAVGNHTRVPRRYRGRDIYAWMDAIGMLDERAEDSCNLEAARRQPSFQLVGRRDHRNLDLAVMRNLGVRLVGHLASAAGSSLEFMNNLSATTTHSHERMRRVLDRIDAFIARSALEEKYPAGAPIPPFIAGDSPTQLDLGGEGVRSVIWATGYVRRYPWLHIPVLDGHGEIVHRGGVTASPGLYVLGFTFQRRRRSHFIAGVGLDAEELADLILAHLGPGRRAPVSTLREARR
jgi:putative flavoprotein involved in K+ transport